MVLKHWLWLLRFWGRCLKVSLQTSSNLSNITKSIKDNHLYPLGRLKDLIIIYCIALVLISNTSKDLVCLSIAYDLILLLFHLSGFCQPVSHIYTFTHGAPELQTRLQIWMSVGQSYEQVLPRWEILNEKTIFVTKCIAVGWSITFAWFESKSVTMTGAFPRTPPPLVHELHPAKTVYIFINN